MLGRWPLAIRGTIHGIVISLDWPVSHEIGLHPEIDNVHVDVDGIFVLISIL